MISRKRAYACLEEAAADLKSLSYEELETFAISHNMLGNWQSREVEVDGEKVDVNTMIGKLGRIRKRMSVELTLSAEGEVLQAGAPCLYFERFKSGRLYPSPREQAREAALLKLLPYALLGVAVMAVLALGWHLFLRTGEEAQLLGQRVVTNQNGTNLHTATRLEYGKNEKAVTYILVESRTWDGVAACAPTAGYNVTYVREFRYDSGRERYMTRRLNPLNLAQVEANTEIWSDYDGDDIYGDFTVSGSTATNTRSYEPGVGEVYTASGVSTTIYHHADHLGTLKRRTFSAGNPDANRVFSAFGERLAGGPAIDRYGYVGAHGYQTHGELPFLHVGARYYDPSSGRFLQRDPIGIRDGTNIYAYVRSVPTVHVDPSGLSRNTTKQDFDHFRENPNRYPPISGSPPSPPPGSEEEMEQEKFNENIEAWSAGTVLGGIGCALGGPFGWGIFGLGAAAGLYGFWPL